MTTDSIHAGPASYLTYPVVLDNAAWNRAVYLSNPARVGEMSQRLASVVQAAWLELKQHPDVDTLSFDVYLKRTTGRSRELISFKLTIERPSAEPPFLLIELKP